MTARLYALACKYEQAAEALLAGAGELAGAKSEGRDAAPAPTRTVLRGTYTRFAARSGVGDSITQ